MHPLIIVIIILAVIFLLFTFGGGYYMYRFATLRNKKQKNYWKDELRPAKFLSEEDNGIISRGWKYIMDQSWESVSIESRDGLRLAGHYLEHPSPRGIVIQVHGYRGCGAFDFACAVEPFYKMGLSLLVIDQRSSGDSQGRHITFGYYERYDVVDWAKYVRERFPNLPVIMDGVSMGATTVMLAVQVGYPENVKAIIADCGYTSPGAICRKVLKQWFHLPPFPLYYGAKLWVRLLAKFDLDGVSCRRALKKLKETGIKLLVAHGKEDGFVPCSMSIENTADFTKEDMDSFVQLFTAEGADHGLSYLRCREEYDCEIEKLFSRAGI